MKLWLLVISLIFWFTTSLSAIISSPGMQRRHVGDSCVFEWTVKGKFDSYSLFSLSMVGPPTPLDTSGYSAHNSISGTIRLVIWDVQLSDAGNVSLSVTIGSSTSTDSSALLFVYGYPRCSLTQSSGSTPATEGEALEITCTVLSTSLPAAYRPKLHYSWTVPRFGALRSIANGSATMLNGDILLGYSIRNNGTTLAIDSVQYPDVLNISCKGQEEGASYSSYYTYNITIHNRPFAFSFNPPSKIFSAAVGSLVQLSFSCLATPGLTSTSQWSFVDMEGVSLSLPSRAVATSRTLRFTLTSRSFYGSYSVRLRNSINASTVTFKVLPPGRPEAPSNVKVRYASHRILLVEWNCMWYNGLRQTIFLLLKDKVKDMEVEKQTVAVPDDCYMSSFNTSFQDGAQPNTEYEISIWSSNTLGSSSVVKLTARTLERLRLRVSFENILISGRRAVIRFETRYGNATMITVTCCVESTGECGSRSYPVDDNVSEVVYDNLPNADVYIFDFNVYGGDPSKGFHHLDLVKGVRVSRAGTEELTTTAVPGKDPTSFNTVIIVLAVLLGVAFLALTGILVLHLIRKFRRRCRLRKAQPPGSVQQQKQQHSSEATDNTVQPQKPKDKRVSEMDENLYEMFDNDSPIDHSYTQLEHGVTRPTP